MMGSVRPERQCTARLHQHEVVGCGSRSILESAIFLPCRKGVDGRSRRRTCQSFIRGAASMGIHSRAILYYHASFEIADHVLRCDSTQYPGAARFAVGSKVAVAAARYPLN